MSMTQDRANRSRPADSRARAAGGPANGPTRRGSRGAQAGPRAPSPLATLSGSPPDTGAPGPIRLFRVYRQDKECE